MIQSKMIQELIVNNSKVNGLHKSPADGNAECSYPIYCMDVPVIGVLGSVDWGVYFPGWSNQTRELEGV